MSGRAIVTLTMNPALDRSTSTEGGVVPNRKTRCGDLRTEPGGGGINVARVVSALGGRACAVFPYGGASGDRLRRLLEASPVDWAGVEIQNETRESLVVDDVQADQQFRFQFPGPALREDEMEAVVRRALDEIRERESEYLVLSGSLPPGVPTDFYHRMTVQARRHGVRVVLDTSGRPLAEALEGGVFLVKPNLHELAVLEGTASLDERTAQDAAARLIQRGGAACVVVSMGSQGVLLATTNGTSRIAAPVVPVVSRVGAGDSMVAGIVHRLSSGSSLEESVRFGVACGTAAVMTPGTELCRPDDARRIEIRMATS